MKKIILFAGLFFVLGHADCSMAYEVQTIADTPVKNEFVLGPGKVDLVLNPGEKTVRNIMVTSRFAGERKFKVEVEDFSGSLDANETIKFFGSEKGPYSMKDYVKPEVSEFSLKLGERIILPVEINIPEDSQPGGFYSSVLISTVPDERVKQDTAQTKIISRLGALFFVRVAGDVTESGYLQDFKVTDAVWKMPEFLSSHESLSGLFSTVGKSFGGIHGKGPITFEIYFRNEGNIHLAPSGKIEIKNLLGRKVGETKVENFFAMPNSLRKAAVTWDAGFLFGKYTATVTLDKNYQQTPGAPDVMEVSFWAIPWKILLVAIFALLILWRAIKFVRGKFKFEIKKKGPHQK